MEGENMTLSLVGDIPPQSRTMKSFDNSALLARIDARLKTLGQSREGALIAAHVPKDRIRKIAAGHSPTLGTLEEVALALRWSVGQLLGYEAIDETVTINGDRPGEINPVKLERATRIARAVLAKDMRLARLRSDQLEAELIAEAYGAISDLESQRTPDGNIEELALVMLSRFVSAALRLRPSTD
jgi:hypothetical protein